MALAVIIIYFIVLSILTVYAFHRYILVYLFQRYKNRTFAPPKQFDELPHVTIQLPIYNELYVFERLINAVVSLIYPKDKLHVQVLDDSNDETVYLSQQVSDKLRAEGYDIEYIHRSNRKGFKAGALQAGLQTAKGDFVAIFDADFIPAKDFLLKTIHYFADSQVALVQSRWGHINADYSILTQIQSLMLDGHFIVEHIGRNRSGRFLNFNGTGGIWRRKAIDESGGWHADTLTEDLDLSYRAQMRGWKFIYLKDLVCDAELPIEIDAFKQQQYRWAKGSIQTAKKMLWPLLKSNQPWWIKTEGFFHLTNNVSYLLMTVLSVLMFPSMLFRFNLGWYDMMFLDLPIFSLATFSIGVFYILSAKEIYPDWKIKIKYIPLLMALGYGLCISNARGIAEALIGKESEFTRTPKYRIEGNRDKLQDRKYRAKHPFVVGWELLFGLYYLYAIYFCIEYDLIIAIPFLGLFAFGFLYIALYSIWQGRDYWFGLKMKTIFQHS